MRHDELRAGKYLIADWEILKPKPKTQRRAKKQDTLELSCGHLNEKMQSHENQEGTKSQELPARCWAAFIRPLGF